MGEIQTDNAGVRGVFRTLSKIYDGASWRKRKLSKTVCHFHKKPIWQGPQSLRDSTFTLYLS